MACHGTPWHSRDTPWSLPGYSWDGMPWHAMDKNDAAVVDSKAADIDVSTFMSKLAKKHGFAKLEYTQKRSLADWEQLFVVAAQQISEHAKKQDDQVTEV